VRIGLFVAWEAGFADIDPIYLENEVTGEDEVITRLALADLVNNHTEMIPR